EYLVAPDLARDLSRNAYEHGVPGTVSEGVVDELEVVEVEEQQRHARTMPLGVGDHPVEFFVEAMAIVKSGKRVAFRKIDQLVRRLPLACHVLEQPEVAHRPSVYVLDGMHLLRDKTAVGELDLHSAEDLPWRWRTQDVLRLFLRAGQVACRGREHFLGAAPDQPGARRDHPDAGERRVAVDHQILMGHEKYAGVHRGEQRR